MAQNLNNDAIFPLESNPSSPLLTSVSFRFSVHTTQESITKIYRICDDSLSRLKQRHIAPAQKLFRNWRFVCEQKPYPICFWCRHTSYPIWCRHTVKVEGDTKCSHYSTIKATTMKNSKRLNVRALRFTERIHDAILRDNRALCFEKPQCRIRHL